MPDRQHLVQPVLHELVSGDGRDGVSWLALPDTPAGTLRLQHVHGQRSTSLSGLAVAPGRGLTGSLTTGQGPRWVDDYFASHRISHHFDSQVASEGIVRMVAVPVPLPGIAGALTVGMRSPGTFSDRTLDHLVTAAQKLAVLLSPGPPAWSDLDELEHHLLDLSERLSSPRRESADPSVRRGIAEVEMALVQVAMALNAHHRPTALDSLTDREHQVLAGVARGLTNAAIARRLGLTPNTVKTYLQSAMRKLGVSNRAEAVARCFALSPLPPVADQRSEVEQLGSSAPGIT